MDALRFRVECLSAQVLETSQAAPDRNQLTGAMFRMDRGPTVIIRGNGGELHRELGFTLGFERAPTGTNKQQT